MHYVAKFEPDGDGFLVTFPAVPEAITGGDHKIAVEALKAAEPEIVRASQKGIVHANVAARKVSRLNARVKALQA